MGSQFRLSLNFVKNSGLSLNNILPKPVRNHVKNKEVNNSPLLESVDERLKRFVAARMCVSEQYGFYYCRIPKAANSTIVRTLAAHSSSYDKVEEDPKAEKAKKMFKGFDELKRCSRQYVLDNYFCFTFVRHPDARVLSAYLDKIKGSATKPKSKYYNYSHLSFREFLISLRDDLLYENPHWAPQSELIPFNGEGLHYVGRVESLTQNMEHVCRQLFSNFQGVSSRRHNVTRSGDRIDQYFTDYEKDLTRQLYYKDFKLFYPEDM